MKNTLQSINENAIKNPTEFILRCEEEYIKDILKVAKTIADNDDIKIVALAGPSGSGKTTTAHILCEKLEQMNEKTAVLSLDDFYLPRERLPILPDGTKDIESVNSLDTDLLKECFNEIIAQGKTVLPKFDFASGTRKENAQKIDVGARGIVIVEGLHAINPQIASLVSKNNIYKIYISANLPITDNGKPFMSSRQIRLIRRSLRDEIFRGSDINETLSQWANVIAGEEKFLYCYKDTADVRLKTLHLFEPGVYKERFLKFRDKVTVNTEWRDYFLKTATALEHFEEIDSKLVPSTSLIREFIGEGKYNL